jgi:uncharacterized membrane protein HdeD (DUF308 family)
MDDPLFLPGDQKAFTGPGTHYPRVVTIGLLVAMLGLVFFGACCLAVAELAAGVIMLTVGLGTLSFMFWRRHSDKQMEKRMRERANGKGPNESRSI